MRSSGATVSAQGPLVPALSAQAIWHLTLRLTRTLSRLGHASGVVVLPATPRHAWQCAQRRPTAPRSRIRLVVADRGEWVSWLCRRIPRLGGHPFLRLNTGGTFGLVGPSVFDSSRGEARGTAWQKAGWRVHAADAGDRGREDPRLRGHHCAARSRRVSSAAGVHRAGA